MASKTIKIVHNHLGYTTSGDRVSLDHIEASEVAIKHDLIVSVNTPVIGWIMRQHIVSQDFLLVLKENGLGISSNGGFVSMHSVVIDFAVGQKTLNFLSLEDANKAYNDIVNIIS